MSFSDYKWDDDSEQVDALRNKYNAVMTLLDELPIVPVGTILDWQGNPNDVSLFDGSGIGVVGTVMANFALCLGQPLDGSLLKNYDGSILSTAPNRKGKFPVGWDPADADYNEFGKTGGGPKLMTLAIPNLPAHTHSYVDDGQGGADAGGNLSGSGESHMINQIGQNKTTGSTGTATPFDNRPPFVTTGYIIRYK